MFQTIELATPQISMIRHTPPEAVLDSIVDWRAQSLLIPKWTRPNRREDCDVASKAHFEEFIGFKPTSVAGSSLPFLLIWRTQGRHDH